MRLFWLLLILFVPAVASALQVKSQTQEFGYYELKECEDEEISEHVNMCGCQSQIDYPVVASYSDEALQTAVNEELKALVSGAGCNAEDGGAVRKGDKTPDERIPNEYQVSFETPYVSKNAASLLMSYYTYGAGAAHGMTTVQGILADLTRGIIYQDSAVLDDKQADAINSHIQTTLRALNEEGQYQGNLWLEDEEGHPRIYVSEEGCDGCTVYRGKNGWVMAFQQYAIASYADGIIEIDIPESFIKPSILELVN